MKIFLIFLFTHGLTADSLVCCVRRVVWCGVVCHKNVVRLIYEFKYVSITL